MTTTTNVLAGCILLCLSTLFLSTRGPKLRLPPGPTGLPLIGNLLQLSPTSWKDVFPQWARTYGPLTYFTVGQTRVLVLNTHKAAQDLLDKRLSIYSSRPRMIVASDYMCGGLFNAIMPYNDIYRRTNKCAHEILMNRRNSKNVTDLVFRKEAATFCSRLLGKEVDCVDECHRAMVSVISRTVFGEEGDAPTQMFIEEFTPMLTRNMTLGGTHPVEFFPWLKYLPLPWKARYSSLNEEADRRFTDAFRAAQTSGIPSLSQNVYALQDKYNFSELESAWLLANFRIAGTDATGHTFRWYVLAMLLHPDVQEKCRQEIDAVVGRSRLPGPDDWERLPYLQATINELLRWRPVLVAGIPHTSIKDDVYDGYHIPKGTNCIANIWYINHDRDTWGEDADSYNPNRFMRHTADRHDGHASFGYGRRMCSGRLMANDILLTLASTLLWAFEILPPKSGVLPDPNEFVEQGMIQCTASFQSRFLPRCPNVARVLHEAASG